MLLYRFILFCVKEVNGRMKDNRAREEMFIVSLLVFILDI